MNRMMTGTTCIGAACVMGCQSAWSKAQCVQTQSSCLATRLLHASHSLQSICAFDTFAKWPKQCHMVIIDMRASQTQTQPWWLWPAHLLIKHIKIIASVATHPGRYCMH